MTIEREIPLFQRFELETSSLCNRRCPGCMRNSYPERGLVGDWFQQQLLASEIVYSLIDQLERMEFRGSVCLQHFNEPLLDERIVDFGRYAREKRRFSEILLCTNGDFISHHKAQELDGVFDTLILTSYVSKTQAAAREQFLSTIFRTTRLVYNNVHLITHFSPDPRLTSSIQEAQRLPCVMGCRYRMIVNHRGDMLLCCDDLIGNFALGNVRDHSLEELWYGERHQKILKDLEKAGGRGLYPHCAICPRRE